MKARLWLAFAICVPFLLWVVLQSPVTSGRPLVSKVQYPHGTTFNRFSGNQVRFLWSVRDGKSEVVYGIVEAPSVYHNTQRPDDDPVHRIRNSASRPMQSNEYVVVDCTHEESTLIINGQRMPITKSNRIFALLPGGKVQTIPLTQSELDSLTPSVVQNSLSTTPVWINHILPVTDPKSLIPHENITRVFHRNKYGKHEYLSQQGHWVSHIGSLAPHESSVFCCAQWRSNVQGDVLDNAVFAPPGHQLVDIYSDDEESLPTLLERYPSIQKSPGISTLEVLPTGMYVNNQLLEPGMVAVIQDDGSYKTVTLTIAERKALNSYQFNEGLQRLSLFEEKILPLFGPEGRQKMEQLKASNQEI
jgi:hypothetical protein